MKKSFLKRVMAAAVAVPVALTQTVLFPSFAVDDTADGGKTVDVNTFTDVATEATIEKLVSGSEANVKAKEAAEDKVTKDKVTTFAWVQKSTWNDKLEVALKGVGDKEIELDPAKLAESIASQGTYVDMAKDVLLDPNTKAFASVEADKVTITLKIDYDYVESARKTLFDKLNAKYPGIINEDELALEGRITGSVIITADMADLANKNVQFTVETDIDGTNNDGSVSVEGIVQYVQDLLDETKAKALETLNTVVEKYEADEATAYQQKAEAEAARDQAIKDRDAAEATFAEKKAELDAMDESLKDTDEYKKAQDDYDTAYAEFEQKKQELEDKIAELEEASAKLEQASKDLDDAEALANEELDKMFDTYQGQLDRAKNYLDRLSTNFNRSVKAADADELWEKARAFAEKKAPNKSQRIPDTLDEAIASDPYTTLQKIFNEVVNQINEQTEVTKIDMTLPDLTDLAKDVYDIEVNGSCVNYAVSGDAFAYLPDEGADYDEAAYKAFVQEQVDAMNEAAEEGVAYEWDGTIEHVKCVEVEGNANANGLNGDGTLDVYRVIYYTVKETEEETTESNPTETETDSSDASEDTTGETESTENPEGTTGETESTENPEGTTGETESTENPEGTEGTTGETESTETPTQEPVADSIVDVVADGGRAFYFSHDSIAFDPAELIVSASGVVKDTNGDPVLDENGEEKTMTLDELGIENFTFGTTLTGSVEGLSPKDVYEDNKDEVPYIVAQLNIYYKGELVNTDAATVYIGVKGDANLDGSVTVDDATTILKYNSESLFGDAYLYSSEASSSQLENFAYFLADVNGESIDHGATTANGEETSLLNVDDATGILKYNSKALFGEVNWIPDVLNAPYPKYAEAIAKAEKLID